MGKDYERQKKYNQRTHYEAIRRYRRENIKNLKVNLTPEMHEEFKEQCKKAGISMSGFLRDCIRDYLSEN